MSGKISSLNQRDSYEIKQYGREIGRQMQDTIQMIGKFLDHLKNKSFRYSMFQEVSAEFAQVPKP